MSMNEVRGWRMFCVAVAGLVSFGLTVAAANDVGRQTYTVHQAHPAASDENPGTADKPWATINAALDHIDPGDTVQVRAGVYREQMILAGEPWSFGGSLHRGFPSGGGYGRMITFEARAGDDVVIKGSDVVADWRRHEGAVWFRENWLHNSQQVFVDGKPLRQIGGTMVDLVSRGDRFRGRLGEGLDDLGEGTFFVDLEAERLYVHLPGGSDPNGHLMEASVRPFFFCLWRVDFIRLSGFKMRHSNTSSAINWGALRIDGSHHILEDLDVAWCDYIALHVSGDNTTVVNSRFNHNGNSGIGGSGWGHRFIGCETSHNNNRNWDPNWHAGGVKIIPGAHDLVMSGHVAAHNRGHGIWFDAWMSNVTIRDSIVHDNDGMGIFYEIGERGVIKNNRVYHNRGRGIYVADSSDTLVAHNLAYRNGMSGIVVIGTERRGGRYGRPEDGILDVRNNRVLGNILVDNNWPDLAPDDWGIRPELILPDDRLPTNAANRSDDNLYYRTDGRPIPFWEGWNTRSHRDLAAWHEATGQDAGSKLANALFVDRVAHDFRPAAGSPAIGIVHPQMSVRDDAAGRDRIPSDTLIRFTAGPFEPFNP